MKILYSSILFILLFLGLSNNGSSQCTNNILSHQQGFIENTGQLNAYADLSSGNALFYMKNGNSFAYFFSDRVSLVTKRLSKKPAKKNDHLLSDISEMDIARIDLVFNNSITKDIIALEEQLHYYNFVTSSNIANSIKNKNNKDITSVKVYEKLLYKNIYKNIDLLFYFSEKSGLKYDFLVNPGGNPADIKMEYIGTEGVVLNNDGSLVTKNSLMKISDSAPIAFHSYEKSYDSPLNKIDCIYQVQNNEISFLLDNYEIENGLIIDPNLEWTFLFGGMDGDHGYSIQIDRNNNLYLAGNTLSGDFPVTPGAWQYQKGGHFDAYIAKFTASGKLLWATFFGGTQAEYVYDMKLDRFGNIVIGGWTWSADMPVSEGAFQEIFGGAMFTTDCFIAKFDNNGKWLWSTFYGSYANEHINAIDVDRNGLIAAVGWTNSRSFVVSPNAFQDTLRGAEDAFLARFTQDGEFIWATFYGSDSLDKATSVAYDKNGNIVMCGHTQSIRINVSNDAYQRVNMGGNDCFIAKFNPFGEMIWSTYFGRRSHDFAEDLVINQDNEIIICGRTSSDSLPFFTENIQSHRKNKEDAFLAKFSSSGNLLWGTYLGGSEEDAAYAVNVDRNGEILVTGRTNSRDFPVTPGAFMTENAGEFDAFITKIDKSGKSMFWSTYAGGTREEWGEDIISDDSLNVIVSGTTNSSDFPIIGDVSSDKFKGLLDIFIMKFCPTNPYPVITPLGPTEFCKGDSVILDAGAGYLEYLWSEGSTTRRLSVTKSGIYYVTVADSGGCYNSSAPVQVIAREEPKPAFDKEIFICSGDTLLLSAGEDFSKYLWSTGDTTPSIKVFSKGKITCRVTDDFGCFGIGTTEIFVNSRPATRIEGPHSVCLGSQKIVYETKGTVGNRYLWTIDGGEITRGQSTNKIETQWLKSGSATITVVETVATTGCSATASYEVIISDELTPEIETSTGENAFCESDSIMLDAGIGYAVYRWSDGSSDRFLMVNKPGSYIVTVWDEQGCSGRDTIEIAEKSKPEIIVEGDRYACHNSESIFSAYIAKDYEFRWNVSGGDIVEDENYRITIKWGTGRSASVYLQITDTRSGCIADTTILVQLSPNPEIKIKHNSPLEFCEGEVVVLYIEDDFSQVLWNGLISGKSIVASKSGFYDLMVIDNNGCYGYDTVEVIVHPRPEKPLITRVNDTLYCQENYEYQWFKDGVLIQGENKQYYVPSSDGDYKVTVYNEFGCENASEEYYFETTRAFARFALKDTIWANIGNMFDLPVFIVNSKDLRKVDAKRFQFIFSVNKTIMRAKDNPKIIETIDSWHKLEYVVEITDTIGKIANLPFEALWGDTECSEIIFESAKCLDADVSTEVVNGIFCLNNLCKEGGTRLFFVGDILSLDVRPIPVTDKVEILYSLRENGLIKLSVHKSIGNEVMVLENSWFKNGKYNYILDAFGFSAGIYFISLKTETKVITKKFIVVK